MRVCVGDCFRCKSLKEFSNAFFCFFWKTNLWGKLSSLLMTQTLRSNGISDESAHIISTHVVFERFFSYHSCLHLIRYCDRRYGFSTPHRDVFRKNGDVRWRHYRLLNIKVIRTISRIPVDQKAEFLFNCKQAGPNKGAIKEEMQDLRAMQGPILYCTNISEQKGKFIKLLIKDSWHHQWKFSDCLWWVYLHWLTTIVSIHACTLACIIKGGITKSIITTIRPCKAWRIATSSGKSGLMIPHSHKNKTDNTV